MTKIPSIHSTFCRQTPFTPHDWFTLPLTRTTFLFYFNLTSEQHFTWCFVQHSACSLVQHYTWSFVQLCTWFFVQLWKFICTALYMFICAALCTFKHHCKKFSLSHPEISYLLQLSYLVISSVLSLACKSNKFFFITVLIYS